MRFMHYEADEFGRLYVTRGTSIPSIKSTETGTAEKLGVVETQNKPLEG